jgi:hypothetical protein
MSKMVLVCASLALLAIPAVSQAQEVTPTQTYASHSCGTAPLSIGVAVAGGEILVSAGEETIKGLPGLELRAGGEVARSAFAGMRNQAMTSVIGWYECRLIHNIRVDGGPDAEARVGALRAAMADINSQLMLAQAARESSFSDYQSYVQSLSTLQRPPAPFLVPPGTFDRYFADTKPNDVWIRTRTIRGWIEGGTSGVKVTACGGVIMAALSDGSSSIQASLASIQSSLKNYFDGAIPPRVGLLGALSGYASNPVSLTTAEARTFEGCAAAMNSLPPEEPEDDAPPPTPSPEVLPAAPPVSTTPKT